MPLRYSTQTIFRDESPITHIWPQLNVTSINRLIGRTNAETRPILVTECLVDMYAPKTKANTMIKRSIITSTTCFSTSRNSDDFSFSNRFPETLGFMCAIHGNCMYLGLMKVPVQYEGSKPQVIHFCTVIDRARICTLQRLTFLPEVLPCTFGVSQENYHSPLLTDYKPSFTYSATCHNVKFKLSCRARRHA